MQTWVVITVSVVVIAVAVTTAVFFDRDGVPEAQPAPAPVTAVPEDNVVTPVDTSTALPVAGVILPSFDVVRISREGTGVIAGRAAPEAFVEVLADGRLVGRVRANRDGEWVLIFDTPLEVGSQELSLRVDVADGTPLESANVVVVSVPARTEPSFEDRPEDGVVAILTPRDGKGVSRVLQRPGVFRTAIELGVDTLDYSDDGSAVFSGFAPPGAEIRLYLDNMYLTTLTADESGRWTYAPDAPLSAGEHVLRLDQILGGDDVEMRVEQPFDPSLALDISLAESSVLVKTGNNLWNIARRVYGHGLLYTQIFQANEGQIRDPELIYPGQKFVLPRDEARDAEGVTAN